MIETYPCRDERAYCLICRDEMLTESGHVCARCASRKPVLRRTLAARFWRWLAGYLAVAVVATVSASPEGFFDSWIAAKKSATELWTPDELPSLFYWAKADAISGLTNNAPVDTWLDSGPYGYTLTSTTTNRPTYKTAQFNGLPSVYFNRQHFLRSSKTNDWKFLHDNDTNGYTVLGVIYLDAYSGASHGIFGTSETVNQIGMYVLSAYTSSNISHRVSSGGGLGFMPCWNATLEHQACISNLTFFTIRADLANATVTNRSAVAVCGYNEVMTNINTTATSTGNPYRPFEIGSISGGVVPMKGYISEMIIFTNRLGTNDFYKVRGYAAHKWGLQSQLAADDPYKTAPPYK